LQGAGKLAASAVGDFDLPIAVEGLAVKGGQGGVGLETAGEGGVARRTGSLGGGTGFTSKVPSMLSPVHMPLVWTTSASRK